VSSNFDWVTINLFPSFVLVTGHTYRLALTTGSGSLGLDSFQTSVGNTASGNSTRTDLTFGGSLNGVFSTSNGGTSWSDDAQSDMAFDFLPPLILPTPTPTVTSTPTTTPAVPTGTPTETPLLPATVTSTSTVTPLLTGCHSYLLQWGSLGTGNGQFNSPYGIAVDGSGNVFVVDYGDNRIEKFTANGTYVAQWGVTGIGNGQFAGPVGVAADASGNVYVADASNNPVLRFDAP